MVTIDVYYDYASPFVYIATQILRTRLESFGVEVRWKPIALDQLSNYADGPPYSALKRRYVVVDAARAAEYYGVEIRIPKPHPVRSILAVQLALVAQSEAESDPIGGQRFESLHRELALAAWRDQKDLSEEAVLAGCIERAGGPVDAWIQKMRSEEVGEWLALRTQAAEARGVFGVPMFFLGGEPFWGLDSLPTLEWRITQRAAETQTE